MTGQESMEDKIRRLEKEINALREEIRAAAIKEESLITRLKEYENAFYSELNAQVKVYKQTWTWRIGRLFVDPADWILSLLRLKKNKESDQITILNTSESRNNDKINIKQESTAGLDDKSLTSNPSNKNLAVIFDTFTQSCFAPEFNQIRFTPENWKKVLITNPVEGLFIESAWRGYGDTWKDKIANISSSNQSDVIKLVGWAKQQNIPTIFWNKEDPVHFEQFIGLAKLFDYIFTTDSDCIPKYQKHAPRASIHPLPFAAQPLIHNPISYGPRNKSVCFAGTYYDQRYHERKADMDYLLKPSLDFGLEIFDRHHGDKGKFASQFKFPDIYQDVIKGKLDYTEMVKAYKEYKIFLNANSVKYSPTMCARRVFELLACGTPVISTYSQGIINLLGEDTVFISESEQDTRKHLEYLLHDELNWWKASLNGMRKVMQSHTYAERTKYIFDIAGLKSPVAGKVKFSVVSKVSDMKEIRYLEYILRRQNFVNLDVILLIDNAENASIQMDDLRSLFAPFVVKIFGFNDDNLENKILSGSDSTHIAFFHTGKYYGPNYLLDFSIALKYADPVIMGKKSTWRLEEGGSLTAIGSGSEYKYVSDVCHATSIHRKSTIDSSRIRNYAREGHIHDQESRILSIDPFNYLDTTVPTNEEISDNPVLNNIDL